MSPTVGTVSLWTVDLTVDVPQTGQDERRPGVPNDWHFGVEDWSRSRTRRIGRRGCSDPPVFAPVVVRSDDVAIDRLGARSGVVGVDAGGVGVEQIDKLGVGVEQL